MRLSDWILRSGGRVTVASRLGVTPEAVHYWLAGKSTPEWKTIFKIVDLSKGEVSPAEIIEETKLRERCAKKRAAR